MDEKPKPTRSAETPRKPYQPPRLTRWGKLRDLTLGGGGNKAEPVTKIKTRF